MLGQKYQCMIDTGSSYNIIRSDLVPKLKHKKHQISKTFKKLTIANNTNITINKVINLIIKIENYTWKLPFLIVKNLPCSIILGNHFLHKVKANLNFQTCNFTIPSRNLNIPIIFNFNDQLHLVLENTAKLRQSELEKLEELKQSYKDVLCNKIGHATNHTMKILLKDRTPTYKHPYTMAPPKAAILQNIIDDLLQQNVIEKCTSSWASPTFLVKKRDGNYRIVHDYREVNKKILFDPYPSSQVQDCFNSLHGAKIFSSLDLVSSYHQIPLDKNSRNITAFVTPQGQYRYLKAPQGLANSSQALNRIMMDIFGDLKYKFCIPYADDLLIYSKSIEEHFDHLQEVFDRLKLHGLTAKPEKCRFFMTRLKYLGLIIDEFGQSIDMSKVQAINDLPPPRNLKQLRSFLGMTGYFMKFIENYADICLPLNKLRQKHTKFEIKEEHLRAFNNLKDKLTSAPILKFPDFSKQFIVRCDASDHCIAGVLLQRVDDVLHPIAYTSRKLSPAEAKTHIYEKEALSLISTINKFQDYLQHAKFIVQTDNNALSYLFKNCRNIGKLARWQLTLANFQFDVEHINGSINNIADALSRLYSDEDTEQTSINPTSFLYEDATPEDKLLFLNEMTNIFPNIRTAQLSDEKCKDITLRLNNGDDDVQNFSLHRGLLCRKTGKLKKRRIYVPECIRGNILHYFHDSLLSSHQGVVKTYSNISKRFSWENMYKDVVSYVKSCDTCQRHKISTKPKPTMQAQNPSYVYQALHIDILGPLPMTKDKSRFLLVAVDSFSRFLQTFPLKTCTSAAICAKLEISFLTFSAPFQMFSDNASYFRSKVYKDFCYKWGIRARFLSPYSPSGNKSEAMNKVLISNVSTLLQSASSSHSTWDKFVSFATFAYNNSFSPVTNTTPASIFFGRTLTFPLDHLWEIHDVLPLTKKPSEEVVKRFLDTSLKTRRKYFDRGKKSHGFRVNDLVMLRKKQVSVHGISSKKFSVKYLGPYLIVNFKAKNTAVLKNTSNGRCLKCHVMFIKKYHKRTQ